MDYIMSLEIESFIELVEKAREEDIREQLWQEWLTLYPYMVKGELQFVSFQEFYDRHFEPPKPKKTEEEIIEESEMILKSLSKEMG